MKHWTAFLLIRYGCLLLIWSSFVVSADALELVVNGGFEQPWGAGDWQPCQSGPASVLERATDLDPDPDFEARLSCGTGTGYTRLDQTVHIPGPATQLTFRARMSVDATSSAWAAAGLVIAYLDQRGFTQAETRVYTATRYCPWVDSPTLHLLPIGGEVWQSYVIDIAEDLTHFPGMDPEAVQQVRISLLAQTYNC